MNDTDEAIAAFRVDLDRIHRERDIEYVEGLIAPIILDQESGRIPQQRTNDEKIHDIAELVVQLNEANQ